jgi:hypothetical protein
VSFLSLCLGAHFRGLLLSFECCMIRSQRALRLKYSQSIRYLPLALECPRRVCS